MFTKTELLTQFDTLSMKPMHFWRYSEVYRGSAESRSEVFRGWVTDFESALQFYFGCRIHWEANYQDYDDWKVGWQGWLYKPHLEDILCQPISLDVFQEKTRECLSYNNHEANLPPRNEFEEAMLMSNDWNDIAVLARFRHEYLYVQWHTSA